MEVHVRKHISDNCGWHHRRVLLSINNKSLRSISTMLHAFSQGPHHSPTEVLQQLRHEMSFLTFLALCFPGHEVLWYHRRWLMLNLRGVASANPPTLVLSFAAPTDALFREQVPPSPAH